MSKLSLSILIFLQCLICTGLIAQPAARPVFSVLPLGIKGGLDESNLSAYLIAPFESNHFICADAGTIRHGLDIAMANKILPGNAEDMLKNNIAGYLISHPHLDHTAGLIMNSPEDSPKNIYAFPSVIETMKDKYFTWKAWANFTNEGELPHLNKYSYVYLKETETTELKGTEMNVTPFSLSHGPGYQSSAFLIGSKSGYLLYLGDTGADSVEHSGNLQLLWQAVAPLIKEKKLKAIFIETSFPNKQPEKLLFGHLTPRLLMSEMKQLEQLSGPSLKNVPVVLTHSKAFGKDEDLLKAELRKENVLRLKLLFPVQGKMMFF